MISHGDVMQMQKIRLNILRCWFNNHFLQLVVVDALINLGPILYTMTLIFRFFSFSLCPHCWTKIYAEECHELLSPAVLKVFKKVPVGSVQ